MPSGGGYSIVPLGTLAFDFAVAPAYPLAQLAKQLDRDLIDEDVQPYRAVVVADTSRALPANLRLTRRPRNADRPFDARQIQCSA